MSKSPKPLDTLDETKVRLAGSAASLLALLGTAAAVIGLIAHLTGADVRSDVVLYLLLLTAFAGAGVIAGIQLLRGRQSAQQFLLVYWLCVMVAAAVMTLGVILWKVPEPWAKAISPNATPAGLAGWVSLLGVVLLVLGGGAVGLLAATTAPGSRQRYASMVLVSVGVALALVVAINLIGQYESPNTGRKNFVHVSMETLGRYGLSDRTKNVLRDVQKRIALTCVYTSTDEAKRTDELRPRVLELLEDMKLYGKDVSVTNVTSDSGKAKLLDRLRGQLGSQAEKHDKFLRGFQKDSDALLGLLAEQQKKWQGQAPDSYLNLWGLAAEIAHVLEDGGEKLTRSREKLDAALKGGGLPDYDALSRDIQDAVKKVRENLEKGGELIGQIAKISAAAADPKKQEAAKKAIADCAAAAEAMAQNIGAPGSAVPDPPGDVLGKHVAASRKAAELALAVAKELDGLAGEDNAQLLRQSEPFMVPLQAGGPMPVSVALSDFYRLIAQRILEAASEAEAIVKNAKADYQKKFIAQVRAESKGVVVLAGQARQAAEGALKALATVDAASKAELEAAASNKLFGELAGKLKATVDAIEKLPKLEDTSLSRDISGDNIVIVEVGEKAEVVDFDEVWPLQNGMGMPRGDQPEKRAFNGDAAIGSKVLKMTEKPFATVLLTYWDPSAKMPPQMRQMQRTPPSDIPAQMLGTIRRRLEEANFKVAEWNLDEDMPDPNEDKDRPKLLLILPPPPSTPPNPMQRMPQPPQEFGDAERQKVLDAIDMGTPAIFLAAFSPPRQANMFMPPTQTPYGYGDYLRDEWGINLQVEYLVVPAVTDDQMPGRYKVDGQRFSYLPLSAFSDHPIGKPLQAQRVLWTNLCPITRNTDARGEPAAPPDGVKIRPLLSIPAYWQSTWATRRIQELLDQFRSGEGSYIWPNYAAGDLPAPFDVAVAATRTQAKARPATQPASAPASRPREAAAPAEEGSKPARIVVLGTGYGLTDGYLDREVAVRDAKGTISLTDPPRANADLLINSAYWLIGRENLIAAGPALATMKEIPPGMKLLLIVLYCGVLPAAVLGAGSLVMLRRRR